MFKVLFLVIFISGCSSLPNVEKLPQTELTDEAMDKTLLNLAIKNSSLAAPDSLDLVEQKIPSKLSSQFKKVVEDSFDSIRIRNSIKEKLMKGIGHDQLVSLVKNLRTRLWHKFQHPDGFNEEEGRTKFMKIYESLDEGTFDLTTKRSRLVAALTDYAFLLNLVQLSNKQVLNMLQPNSRTPLTAKQKLLVPLFTEELNSFHQSHVKGLFASTYLTTETLSENELEQLVEIKHHDFFKIGRMALEEELAQSYHRFYINMKKLL
jgi:hypothetical protein